MKPAALFWLALVLAPLAACGTVSSQFEATVLSCSAAFGGYHLPTGLLKVTVTDPDSRDNRKISIEGPVPAADRDLGPVCLYHSNSILSQDDINVRRDSEGLLMSVASKAVDRTPNIAENIADIQLAVRGPSAVEQANSFEFNPFDLVEAARINTALSALGYCVVVENVTAPHVGEPHYCANPKPPTGHVDIITARPAEEVMPDGSLRAGGILYRPLLPRVLNVYWQEEPGRGKFKLLERREIAMPNGAPVFVLRVPRAAFATRTTNITFEHGVLRAVEIDKTSEVVGFLKIPLEITDRLISIPAEILQIRIGAVTDQQRLIATQAQLLEAYRARCEVLYGTERCVQPVATQADLILTGLPLGRGSGPAGSFDEDDIKNAVNECTAGGDAEATTCRECILKRQNLSPEDAGIFCRAQQNGVGQ